MDSKPLAKKSLGQHWLEDDNTLALVSSYGELSKTDLVIEIGPGYGTLTSQLVKAAKEVIAIELDDKLARQLPVFVDAKNLKVVHESILSFDLTKLPKNYKVVANIPYYLTSNLFRVFSESSNPPSLVVLLIQKEVAERLVAKPGQMSILSVTSQFFWDIEAKEVISRQLFAPPPKVDSQIVVLKRKKLPMFDLDSKSFFRLVKMGFSARRKTLLNSLTNGLRADKGEIEKALKEAQIDSSLRPQTLTMQQWFSLYKSMHRLEII